MPRGSNLTWPYVLPGNWEDRWQQPHLKQELGSDEAVIWLDLAASGLLTYPWITWVAPVGSALWDVAMTESRIVAVRHLMVPIVRRKVRVFPLAEIEGLELQFHTKPGSVILSLKTAGAIWKLKMVRMSLDYARAERVAREFYPDVVVSGL